MRRSLVDNAIQAAEGKLSYSKTAKEAKTW